MTPPLFLLPDLPDLPEAEDALLRLDGAEGRHAATVRRLRVGERVWLGDGTGTICDAVIVELAPAALTARVLGRRHIPRPDPTIAVVQALPKGERAELAVEVLTELGADAIVPWAAARCVTRWQGERADKALQRWRRTAREAAKQSRRAWLPEVPGLIDTPAACARLGGSSLALVLHEEAAEALSAVALPRTGQITLVVGPEGGITAEESAAFRAAGARAVRLGDLVLRTSTAGAAALAVLSARLGRWGG